MAGNGKALKICVLSTTYPRNERDSYVPFIRGFAHALGQKYKVKVVAASGRGVASEDALVGIKVKRFQYFWPKAWQRLTYRGGMMESFRNSFFAKMQAPVFMLSFLIKGLKETKDCDIIHAHWTLSGFVGVVCKKAWKKPLVVTVHGGDLLGLPKWFNRYVLMNADVVMTAHHDMAELARKLGRKDVLDVKNFLDWDKFSEKVDVRAVRQELGFSGRDFVVTFIARFEPRKDPMTFVKAARLLKDYKTIKFLMVGEGSFRHIVEKQAEGLSNLKLLGARHDVHRILKASDLFCAISPLENVFSTTII